MTASILGPSTPDGHVGFTISVELDLPLSDMTDGQEMTVLRTITEHKPRLDESLVGNTLFVVDLPPCPWWDAGNKAIAMWRKLERDWNPVGIEICRTDLWIDEPYFDHEPDGVESGPSWPDRSDREGEAIVAIEVEPENSASKYPSDNELTHIFHRGPRGRTSRSNAGRPQLVVEMHGSALDAVQTVTKPAFTISGGRTITRIRAIRSDLYISIHSDLGEPEARQFQGSGAPGRLSYPEWSYVTDVDGNRSVIVTDLHVRLADWNLRTTTIDGETQISSFAFGCGWLDESGTVNGVFDGHVVDAWEAPVAAGARVEAFLVGERLMRVDPWEQMTEVISETMYATPAGFVIDLNSRVTTAEGYDDEIWSAQIASVTSGAFLLRRSRSTLAEPVLSRYPIVEDDLNLHRGDGFSSDCTDGYTISRNRRRIARESIDWFRVLAGIDSCVAVSVSHRHVDPAHTAEVGIEPGTQARHAASGSRYQYWGDGSGSRIDRLVRASDPEDTSTAESYHHTHGWNRSDDAEDALMRARVFGEWAQITEDEAMRAIKIEHRPDSWQQ